ncbi:anthranilate phosphoribosyltransferase [Paenibacillus chartarius]|uniref:Anthranilate phosphoribosyltransferase n=1 Tax=Paenibacillus chartarius TaxID=747481 RepID=A0ABV6DJ07_9BACL
MKQWIQAVWDAYRNGETLTSDITAAAAAAIANGTASDGQSGAFLTAMRMKGETAEELHTMVEVFRQFRCALPPSPDSLCIGGTLVRPQSFLLSLAVSLVLASAGFPQSITSSVKDEEQQLELLRCLRIDTGPQGTAGSGQPVRTRIGYLPPTVVCPPLSRLRALREELGMASLLDDLELVLNPLDSRQLLLGIGGPPDAQRWAPLLPLLGYQLAYLVEGMHGSEVLPLYKPSYVRIVSAYGDETRIVDPQTFGFYSEPLLPDSTERLLDRFHRVLQNETGFDLLPDRDHVIFNAALRLLWFDKVATYEEGFVLVTSLLQRKEPWRLLQRWREQSAEKGDAKPDGQHTGT